jgi:hypothetical protein
MRFMPYAMRPTLMKSTPANDLSNMISDYQF